MRKSIILALLILMPTLCWSGLQEKLQGVIAKKNASTGCNYSTFLSKSDANRATAWWMRVKLPADLTTCNGTQIRISVQAHSEQTSKISGSSICTNSGNVEDCAADITRITWATASGIDISAGQTAVSDWITFTWDKTGVYNVHFQMVDSGTQYYTTATDDVCATYIDSDEADDKTLTQDVTRDGALAGYCHFITKIEVQ
jgi:hypothetical protein